MGLCQFWIYWDMVIDHTWWVLSLTCVLALFGSPQWLAAAALVNLLTYLLTYCDFPRISLGPQFESRSGRVSFDESLPACHSIGSVTCLTVGDSSGQIKLL